MKNCPYCQIEVGGELKKCPFCQSSLVGVSDTEYFPKQTTFKIQSFFYKLQMFIVFAVGIVGLGDEWLLHLDFFHGIHYSIILCVWLLAFEFGIMKLFKKGFHPSRILTIIVIIVTCLLMFTAYEIGEVAWKYMLEWVVPIIVMATLVANFVLAVFDKIANGMIYLLTNIVVGGLPYVVLFLEGKDVPIVWIICLILTVVLFTGTLIFKGRAVVGEVQKRFNV